MKRDRAGRLQVRRFAGAAHRHQPHRSGPQAGRTEFPEADQNRQSRRRGFRAEVNAWLRVRAALPPCVEARGAQRDRVARPEALSAPPCGTRTKQPRREKAVQDVVAAPPPARHRTTTAAPRSETAWLRSARPRESAEVPHERPCRTRRVFDLTPEMLFRRGDGIEVVRLDVLERMVRSGPITGYAPWAPESKSATRVWAAIGADGLVLFDRKTRIAHHWAHRIPASSRRRSSC